MSMPTLLQLHHFRTLARRGSYARAASELHLSQPALTRSIQSLERIIGGKLVERERGRSGVTLTSMGRETLVKATAILAETESLRTGEGGEDKSAQLHFGLGPQFATILLPDVLDAVMRDLPDVILTATIGSTEGMLRQLLDGELEFFISGAIPGERSPRVRCTAFASAELRYAVHPNHPLLLLHRLGIADISRFPRLAGSVFRDRVLSLDDTVSTSLAPTLCLDNFEVLARLTERTDGILATFSRGIQPPLVELPFDLASIVGVSETFVYTLQGFRLTPAAAAVVDLLAAAVVDPADSESPQACEPCARRDAAESLTGVR